MSTIWKPRKQRTAAASVAGVRVLDGRNTVEWLRPSNENQAITTVGRAERCDIVIREQSVSRVHCEIHHNADGTFSIHDLDSHNGIYIASNGPEDAERRVLSAALTLGSFVHAGDVAIVPVDERGRCPMVVYRPSEYVRQARRVYGSDTHVERHLGVSRSLFHRLARALGVSSHPIGR